MSLLNQNDLNSDVCPEVENADEAESHPIPNLLPINDISPIADSLPSIDDTVKLPPTRRHSQRILQLQKSAGPIKSRNSSGPGIRFASLNYRRRKTRAKEDTTRTSIPLAELFSLMKATSGESQESRLCKHRLELLATLNEADQKCLEKLPGIGSKTAVSLIMHRAMLGPFKTLKQVQDLPIWRGDTWERFAGSNFINLQKE